MKAQGINANILLLAMLPSVSIGLVNGFYKESIYHLDPIWFWLADLTQFVFVPVVVPLCVEALWRVEAQAIRVSPHRCS